MTLVVYTSGVYIPSDHLGCGVSELKIIHRKERWDDLPCGIFCT